MSVDIEEVFHLSYWRATQRSVDGVPFLDAFYKNFLASSPRIAEKFERTDFDTLRRMLSISIVHVARFGAAKQPDALLELLARRHSRHDLDIPPALYEDWLESLVHTVAAYDPRFDEGVGQAWRQVLGPGIAYMRSRYDDPDRATPSEG